VITSFIIAFVSTESSTASARRAVVGSRSVSTESSEDCADRAVVEARSVSTENSEACAGRVVVGYSHFSEHGVAM
jgi:hypothetical protein